MKSNRLLSPSGLSFVVVVVILCGSFVLLLTRGNDSDPILDSSPTDATKVGFDGDSIWQTSKPAGEVVTPTAVKEAGGESVQAVLAGRIDAGEMSPFQPGQMAFMLSQLPEQGHGGEDPDHADNCPFCKRKLKNAPKAIVQFVGNDGVVLNGDVQATLGLEKGDIVWATGEAQYNAAVNTVIVDATALYRPSDADRKAADRPDEAPAEK